ncbi:MAG: hypothetical protein AB1578_14790 [Thermodesulfobacteriota bacterium]
MDRSKRQDEAYYNLDGGQRHLIVRGGEVKAVAPGLRLVDATEEEARSVGGKEPGKAPREYGLPV